MRSALPAPIVRARLQLMLREPYLASAVARLPVVDATKSPWCQTMATDGYYIYVNTDFCQSLTEEEIAFVFAHETLHCVLGHIDRRENRSREIWNYAIDYAVNGVLVERGMKKPSAGLHRRDFLPLTAEEIYDRLVSEWAKSGIPSSHVGPDGADARGAAPLDRHIDPDDPEGRAARATDFPSAGERRRLRKSLSASLKGNLPGREAGLLAQEIRAATIARIPWQHLLARFVGGLRRSDYRLYPFNKKHLWRELYLPSLGVPGPEHLVVAIDTSGSMTTQVLAQVLAELDRLRVVTECALTVLQCDTRICRVDMFTAYQQSDGSVSSFRKGYQLHGRGGTDLRPPFEWIAERVRTGAVTPPDALIYMTDGFGPMPQAVPGFPVLWILPAYGVREVPFGTMLRMT